MLSVVGVLLIFIRAAAGLLFMSPHCRFNQSVPSYGAVEHPLYLQLPSEDHLTLKKDSGIVPIFRFKIKTVTQNHRDYPRWQFITENTTMIITNAKKIDSGNYSLDAFSSDGVNKGIYYLQLIIEDVVSSVTVKDSCWSPENRSVYCSSDGDNLSFNWTLSGITLTKLMRDGNQIFLLDKEAVGSVTCLVENHVSRGNVTIILQQCPGTETTTDLILHKATTASAVNRCAQMTESDKGFLVFVCVWLFELIILVSLLVGAFYIYTTIYKKQRAAESKGRVQEEVLDQNKKESIH